jgi:hypothetical protein
MWLKRCRKAACDLLFDLLTPEEEREDLITRRLRFDIDLLAPDNQGRRLQW